MFCYLSRLLFQIVLAISALSALYAGSSMLVSFSCVLQYTYLRTLWRTLVPRSGFQQVQLFCGVAIFKRGATYFHLLCPSLVNFLKGTRMAGHLFIGKQVRWQNMAELKCFSRTQPHFYNSFAISSLQTSLLPLFLIRFED